MDVIENRDSKQQPTLSAFIEINQKLLSVIGIFTAITIFSLNLKLSKFGYGLSFIFLTLTVLLWLEIIQKFPKNGSSRLSLFETILSFGIFGLIIYWIIEYIAFWEFLLPFV